MLELHESTNQRPATWQRVTRNQRLSARLIRLLAASTFALGLCGGVAADPSQAEAAQIHEIGRQLERVCIKRLSELPPPVAPRGAKSLASWLAQLSNGPEYCGCTARAYENGLSPELLQSGTQDQFTTLAKTSGTGCAVARLKTSWPQYCPSILADMRAAKGDVSDFGNRFADFCGCVHTSINELSTDSFSAFTAATVADYEAYAKTGLLPPANSSSLLGKMSACGVKDIMTRTPTAQR